MNKITENNKSLHFYEELANHYDEMTRFNQRFESEKEVMRQWVERLSIQNAVDVACGTGLHAILLASLGVRTTGVEPSAAMLEKAKKHAQQYNVEVDWRQLSMQDMQRIDQKFDVAFCLGNSIPHLLPDSDLEQATQNFNKLLNSGGWLVLQLLNYEKILDERMRIIGINRSGNQEFIRFYDFLARHIQFNVLQISEQNGKFVHNLQSTLLRPYQKKELEKIVRANGFGDLEFYGNMKFADFDSQTSSNLVMVAKKIENQKTIHKRRNKP